MSTLAIPPASPTPVARRGHPQPRPAALETRQLPFAAHATVTASSSLVYPVLGAAVGALLLGMPGALLGAIAGVVLAR